MQNVLITGVTGLLGGELLRELCKCNLTRITALIRRSEMQSPLGRFECRMARSGADVSDYADRTNVVEGNIVLPNWGLQANDLRDCQNNIDTIVHCAADTSFIREEIVAETNIRGTKHLIELARGAQRPPRIVYISTATNVGCVQHCCLKEDDGCQADNMHHNAYTRSKAIAENMLRESGLEVLVIRPTIVLSAGLSDRVFARNIMWFAPLLYQFEALPVDPCSELDVISIEFMARSTIELLKSPDLRHDCYHVSAGKRHGFTIREALGSMNQVYQRPAPQLISPENWTMREQREYVRTREQRMVFHALRYYLPFLNMDVTYDNDRLYAELGQRTPKFDTFESYAEQLLGQIDLGEALQETAVP